MILCHLKEPDFGLVYHLMDHADGTGLDHIFGIYTQFAILPKSLENAGV